VDIDKLIDECGGTSETARLFGITPGAVSQWREKGIPAARLMVLRLLFPHRSEWAGQDYTGRPLNDSTITQSAGEAPAK
jgi:hypothetical protein